MSGDEQTGFDALIDLIYQSAMDTDGWQRAVEEMSRWVASDTCCFFTPNHMPENGGIHIAHASNQLSNEILTAKFNAHYQLTQHNNNLNHLNAGNVIRDQDLVAGDTQFPANWYQELEAKTGYGRMLSGIVVFKHNNIAIPIACSCLRPFSSPFTVQDADKLQQTLPHLSRAMGVMLRLRESELKLSNTLASLNGLSNGLILFGAKSEVTFCNSVAKRLLGQNDGLILSEHSGVDNSASLVAKDGKTQSILDNIIRSAVFCNVHAAQPLYRAVTVRRPSGRPPFILHCSSLPVTVPVTMLTDVPHAVAFISDISSPVHLDGALLKSTYGLTTAEIRIAELLVNGYSLENAAQQLDVSVNTTKTQIRQVHEKIGINNRAGLVRLLLTLTASDLM